MGEEDELEAMFKPKKKRRQERDQADKKSTVEELLARMEVPPRRLLGLHQHSTPCVPLCESGSGDRAAPRRCHGSLKVQEF